MRSSLKLIVLTAFISFLCFSFAEAGEVSVQTSLEPSHATIGDLVQYKVTVTYPKNFKIVSPIKARPKGLQIRSAVDVPETKAGKNFRIEKIYTLTAFDTGTFEMPPVTIEYLDGNSQPGTASSKPTKLTIKSVLGKVNEKTDIRDIKGVVDIQARYEKYLKFLYTAAAILLVGGLILFIRKKLKKKPADVRYLLSPHEEALKSLGELKYSGLIEKDRIKLFYFKLTDILRHYFERVYGFGTEELTTQELMQEISRVSVSDELRARIVRFFEDCDLVKFANMKPIREEINTDFDRSEDIVNQCHKESLPTSSSLGQETV